MAISRIVLFLCLGFVVVAMWSCDPMSSAAIIIDNESEVTLECVVEAKDFESAGEEGLAKERTIEIGPHSKMTIYSLVLLGPGKLTFEELESRFIKKLEIIDVGGRTFLSEMPVVSLEVLKHIAVVQYGSSYEYEIQVDATLIKYLTDNLSRDIPKPQP